MALVGMHLFKGKAWIAVIHTTQTCLSSAMQGVAINFVKSDDIRILRDIEQYYSTQIDEMVRAAAVLGASLHAVC